MGCDSGIIWKARYNPYTDEGGTSYYRSVEILSTGLYLAVMLVVIGGITAAVIPNLLMKKCGKCKARNSLDAKVCKKCGDPFPDDL